jgi:hypothetical protein
VHAPPTGKKWYDSISSIPELQKECEAIARSTRTLREFPHDVIDVVSRARHLAEERSLGTKDSMGLIWKGTSLLKLVANWTLVMVSPVQCLSHGEWYKANDCTFGHCLLLIGGSSYCFLR